MRKEYWIKKDLTKDAQDNWLKLNSYEFVQFKNTPEGIIREKNVVLVPYGEPDDTELYMEVDDITAVEWRSINNHSCYACKCKEKSGIEVFSYHAALDPDADSLSGEELLEDMECNVEEDAIKSVMICEMCKAIKKLPVDDQQLIYYLYLKKERMTEKKYAQFTGEERTTINSRKYRILRTLREMLGEIL